MLFALEGKNRTLRVRGTDMAQYEDNRFLYALAGRLAEDPASIGAGHETNSDYSPYFIGPFLLIRYDKRKKTLLATQHRFGGPCNFYFCERDGNVLLSTGLQELRQAAGDGFRLNEAMLPHYFYNGFLPGKHTLAAGVFKLPPGVFLEFGPDGPRMERIAFAPPDESPENLEELYRRTVEGSIQRSTADLTHVDLALSGGYDSNCILFHVRQSLPKIPVRAFSVGGVRDVDETQIAAAIAAQYENVTFRRAYVSPATLDALDEIVRCLEGAVYERGIFLQYELAKLLQVNGCRQLVCGECADQVFHARAYAPAPPGTFLYGYADTPWEMAAYVVLKKNALMLRAFGIEGRYPFLDAEMLKLGYRTRQQNGISKEFHKQQCRRNFPPEISVLLTKQGGSTALSPLFPEDHDCLAQAQNTAFYDPDFRITQKYSREEAVRDYLLSLLYLESFQRQFCS